MRSTGFAQRLDHDGFGQILAQGDAGVANLTDQAGMPADETDALLFAQTHFAQTINDIRLRSELFDADHRTSLDGRERAGHRFGATSIGSGFGGDLARLFQRG
jgi:hypothetical protein